MKVYILLEKVKDNPLPIAAGDHTLGGEKKYRERTTSKALRV